YHVASILTFGCVDSKRLIASSTKSRLIFSAAQWLHNVSFICWANALDANAMTTTASNHLNARMHVSGGPGVCPMAGIVALTPKLSTILAPKGGRPRAPV